MAKEIVIITGETRLKARLNDSPSARALESMLPLEFSMSRWGDEYYGDCGIKVDLSEDAKDIMAIGELAVWPVGNALCIFFGPTPASKGNEPRAASEVNPVGQLIDNPDLLKKLGYSVDVRIELLQ